MNGEYMTLSIPKLDLQHRIEDVSEIIPIIRGWRDIALNDPMLGIFINNLPNSIEYFETLDGLLLSQDDPAPKQVLRFTMYDDTSYRNNMLMFLRWQRFYPFRSEYQVMGEVKVINSFYDDTDGSGYGLFLRSRRWEYENFFATCSGAGRGRDAQSLCSLDEFKEYVDWKKLWREFIV